MTPNETSALLSIQAVSRLAGKYGFSLCNADKLLSLKPSDPIHNQTYQFAEEASIRDVSLFLTGYDACVKQFEKNNGE